MAWLVVYAVGALITFGYAKTFRQTGAGAVGKVAAFVVAAVWPPTAPIRLGVLLGDLNDEWERKLTR